MLLGWYRNWRKGFQSLMLRLWIKVSHQVPSISLPRGIKWVLNEWSIRIRKKIQEYRNKLRRGKKPEVGETPHQQPKIILARVKNPGLHMTKVYLSEFKELILKGVNAAVKAQRGKKWTVKTRKFVNPHLKRRKSTYITRGRKIAKRPVRPTMTFSQSIRRNLMMLYQFILHSQAWVLITLMIIMHLCFGE